MYCIIIISFFELKHPDIIFSAIIFADNKDAFDFTILNKCTHIIIYGKIELYKDILQIVLKDTGKFSKQADILYTQQD